MLALSKVRRDYGSFAEVRCVARHKGGSNEQIAIVLDSFKRISDCGCAGSLLADSFAAL
jgi:hypothetical protein